MNLPDETLYLETRRKEAASFVEACREPILRKLVIIFGFSFFPIRLKVKNLG